MSLNNHVETSRPYPGLSEGEGIYLKWISSGQVAGPSARSEPDMTDVRFTIIVLTSLWITVFYVVIETRTGLL